MRVALVNPPNTRSLDRDGEHAVPALGLEYIAASLNAAGILCQVVDLGGHGDANPEVLVETHLSGFDLIGFTSYTKTFGAVLTLCEAIKAAAHETRIVVGGPHATPCATEILEDCPSIDFIIKGDGELPMLALARECSNAVRDFASVPNLVFRAIPSAHRSLKPLVVHSDAVVPSPNLDSLPYPSHSYLAEKNLYHLERRRRDTPVPTLFLSSSRGCPKRCTFCSIIVMAPKYRLRSPESIMAEVRRATEHGHFGHIWFLDANFFASARRARDFSRMLYDWDPRISWSGTATADVIVKNEAIVAEIGAMNCLSLEVGIESGSASVLARFGKGTTVDDNLNAIEILRRSNIELDLDFIMFDPDTTLVELRENISFLHRAELFGTQPVDFLVNTLRAYPGTPAFAMYRKRHGPDWARVSLIPPFAQRETEFLYRAMIRFFQTELAKYERTLRSMEEVYATNVASKDLDRRASSQGLAATLIRLRHAPYRLFHEMLERAEREELTAESYECLDDLPSILAFRQLVEVGDRLVGQLIAESSRDIRAKAG